MGRRATTLAFFATLAVAPAAAEASEITSPEDGAEVTSPFVVSFEFSCDYPYCNEYECEETYAETVTLNLDGEPLEEREITTCSLVGTEEFELELPAGEHTLSAGVVYPEHSQTSPEITVEVLEEPDDATQGADGADGGSDDEAGCGCSAEGEPSRVPWAALSILGLCLAGPRRLRRLRRR